MVYHGPMVSVSIILTCYNLERYIEKAIVSCFQQDYAGPMELIIVDDASTDGSVDIINRTVEQYGEGWDVTFIQRPLNGGISAAMDSAIAVAKHEWLIWADGDDVQKPDRCSKTARLVELYPDVCAIYLSNENIDADGVPNGGFNGPMLNVEYDQHPLSYYQRLPEERLNTYKDGHPLQVVAFGCTMAIKRDLWEKWGAAVPENYKGERFAQDPLWECRALLTGPSVASKEVACQYRMHSTNILNHCRDLRSFKGIKKNELYISRYTAKEAAQLKRSQDDIDRAIANPALTDWNPEQLQELRDLQAKRFMVKQACSYWWDKPIWERFLISMRIRHLVPDFMRTWLMARILPLNVYCFIKMLRARMQSR